MSKVKDYKLRFGKHAGKKLSEIPITYLKWLIGNKIAEIIVHEKICNPTDIAIIRYLGLEINLKYLISKVG